MTYTVKYLILFHSRFLIKCYEIPYYSVGFNGPSIDISSHVTQIQNKKSLTSYKDDTNLFLLFNK